MFSNYVSYWTGNGDARLVYISAFLVCSILFNIREHSKIGYWLTAIKIVTIMVIIIFALKTSMSNVASPLFGTDLSYHPVACLDNAVGQCQDDPGFSCIVSRLLY